MTKILGLDLGTNSIGWAVLDASKKRIVDTGVRIFQKRGNMNFLETTNLSKTEALILSFGI